eukprot:s854_g1.t1
MSKAAVLDIRRIAAEVSWTYLQKQGTHPVYNTAPGGFKIVEWRQGAPSPKNFTVDSLACDDENLFWKLDRAYDCQGVSTAFLSVCACLVKQGLTLVFKDTTVTNFYAMNGPVDSTSVNDIQLSADDPDTQETYTMDLLCTMKHKAELAAALVQRAISDGLEDGRPGHLTVTLKGIVKRPQLNGCHARVICVVDGRVGVELESGEKIQVLPEKLIATSHPKSQFLTLEEMTSYIKAEEQRYIDQMLEPGDIVRFHSLTRSGYLNGSEGIVVEALPRTGEHDESRYVVEVKTDGKLKQVWRKNLNLQQKKVASQSETARYQEIVQYLTQDPLGQMFNERVVRAESFTFSNLTDPELLPAFERLVEMRMAECFLKIPSHQRKWEAILRLSKNPHFQDFRTQVLLRLRGGTTDAELFELFESNREHAAFWWMSSSRRRNNDGLCGHGPRRRSGDTMVQRLRREDAGAFEPLLEYILEYEGVLESHVEGQKPNEAPKQFLVFENLGVRDVPGSTFRRSWDGHGKNGTVLDLPDSDSDADMLTNFRKAKQKKAQSIPQKKEMVDNDDATRDPFLRTRPQHEGPCPVLWCGRRHDKSVVLSANQWITLGKEAGA